MWKNERGAVLPLTLCVLLLMSVFFSYQLYTYEQKQTFVAYQREQLMLDNLLQIGLSFALSTESTDQPLRFSHGEVRYEVTDQLIELMAKLQSGARQTATAMVDEDGQLLEYHTGAVGD